MRDTSKLLEVLNMFTILIGDVTQVYAYVQTHQIVYINYVQFSVYQLYPNKAGEERILY